MTSGVFKEVADSEGKGRIKYVSSLNFYKSLDELVRQGDHVLIIEDRYGRVLRAKDFSRTGT